MGCAASPASVRRGCLPPSSPAAALPGSGGASPKSYSGVAQVAPGALAARSAGTGACQPPMRARARARTSSGAPLHSARAAASSGQAKLSCHMVATVPRPLSA